MRHVRYISFLLLLFLTTASSGYSQSIYHENRIRFAGEELKETYHLHKKKSNPTCQLTLNFFYPETYSDPLILEKLQAIFVQKFFGADYQELSLKKAPESFAKNYIKEYKELFEESGLYKKEVALAEETYTDVSELAPLYSFSSNIRNTIMFNRGGILSFVTNFYDYRGGAHGFSRTEGTVVDLRDASELKLYDIIKEELKDELPDLLLTCLMNGQNIETIDDLWSQGFVFDEIPVSENFIADDKGMIFIYDQYELGSYYLGTVEIMVPYYDLIVFMREDSPLYNWAKNKRAGNLINFENIFYEDFYNPFEQVDDFSGFSFNTVYTYPKAYTDKQKLEQLQQLFLLNAFGEKYRNYSPQEVGAALYQDMLSEYQSFTQSDNVQSLVKEVLAEIDEENAAKMITSFAKKFSQMNVFQYNNQGLVSYSITHYTYDGGAHGMETEQGYLIDVDNARNLTYDDVFKSSSRQNISEHIIHTLMQEKGFLTAEQLKVNDYNLDALAPTDNFIFDGQHFTFIYQPYEVGPFSLGLVKVVVPIRDLFPYVKEDSLLYKIILENGTL